MMWTKQFWFDSAERALRTFAQTLVTAVGLDAAKWVTLDWRQILTLSGVAALLAILNYIAAAPRQSAPADAPGSSGDVEPILDGEPCLPSSVPGAPPTEVPEQGPVVENDRTFGPRAGTETVSIQPRNHSYWGKP